MNVRLEIIKHLEENISNKLLNTGLSDVLDLIPKARETKAKLNKRNYIKLKTSVYEYDRKPSTKQRGNLLHGRRYLQIIHISEKDLISKCHFKKKRSLRARVYFFPTQLSVTITNLHCLCH